MPQSSATSKIVACFQSSLLVNPRRACTGGLCVCVSGTTSPATMRNWASNRRYLYLRLRRNLGNILNMAFSLKMLCSKVMA